MIKKPGWKKLEIDLAHALNTIDDLNGVVIQQGRQIERMTRLLSNMTEQVEEMMESSHPGHRIDKPPHY
ncbi:SlyX family protein [Roseibium salinum]|nr:SlyX family protein [Roseibium salinum]